MKRMLRGLVALWMGCFAFISSPGHLQAAETALQNGVPLPLNMPALTFYSDIYIDVPVGATKLTAILDGSSGNFALFVKYAIPITGGTFNELLADADAASHGPSADEMLVLTPTSTPALKPGRWYIAPLNRNRSTTSAILTAGVQHRIDMTVSPPEVYVPGNSISWAYLITPDLSMNRAVDVYAAVVYPDGTLYFLGGAEGFTQQIVPFQIGLLLGAEQESGSFFSNVILPGWLPEGQYIFYAAFAKSGEFPLDGANLMSNVASAHIYFALLSPAQRVFIDNWGYPEQFIKTSVEADGKMRVDETWFYLQRGNGVSFVDGVFVKTDALDAGAFQPGTPGFHPEDYRWDTTEAAVIARHGEPDLIQNNPPGSESFYSVFPADSYYLYSDIVFGFKNAKLVSVAAVK